MAHSRRLKICFVSPTNYSVLRGDPSLRQVGGAEVQQRYLAREFVRRGYEVSMICMDHGQPDGIEIDGVKVYRAHAPNAGIPVIRFLHPRLTSIWQAMRRADADLYYQRTAASLSATVVAFAKLHGRVSVYAGASDRDFMRDTPNIQYARDRALYRWALRHADIVVAQTPTQRDACQRNFGRAPVVIRSCYEHQGEPARRCGPVLWVGNLAAVKRPELFVELARRLPQYRFKLIGGADESKLAALRGLARGTTNLELPGFVPFAQIETHFDGAALLVNTSSNEGFPNTFLQAWSRGMPTVSFFNPRAMVGEEQAGIVVASIDEMASQTARLLEDESAWHSASCTVKSYFGSHFSVSDAGDAYQAEFERYAVRDELRYQQP